MRHLASIPSGLIVPPLKLPVLGLLVWSIVSIPFGDAGSQEKGNEEIRESIQGTIESLKSEFAELPPATLPESKSADAMASEIMNSLAFAEKALARNNLVAAGDALSMARGMIAVALGPLTATGSVAKQDVKSSNSLSGLPTSATTIARVEVNFSQDEIKDIKKLVRGLSGSSDKIENIGDVIDRLKGEGFNIVQLTDTLNKHGRSLDDAISSINASASNWESLSGSLEQILNDPEMISSLSHQAGEIMAELGTDLQAAADAVASAVAAGASVDIEAMASGAGFDSFADAVDAYNEAYGTDYSEAEAAAALGL